MDTTPLKRAEPALPESEEKYRVLFEQANDAVFVAQDGMVKSPNPRGLELVGYSEEEIAGIPFMELVHPEDREMVGERYTRRMDGDEGVPSRYEYRAIHKSGKVLWFELSAVQIMWEGRPAVLNFIRDVTEHKRLEEERETLLQKLKEALAEVKTLSGFLPICSSCKKIRDDKGYWSQIEAYIRDHSEVEFSHGLCPECAKRLYPEHAEDMYRDSSEEDE